ncbi:MAG TPA: FMN-binding protein [Candidatus Cryosericum sp.]|nr:FMN-binding protein [Candidatus Cryosericum sp.]
MKKDASKKRKRRGWLIPVGIICLLALFCLVMIAADAPARREIVEMQIEQIDFDNLKDGLYLGEFTGSKSSQRDVALEVTVQDGAVSSITILHGALDQEGNPTELNSGISAQDFLQSALKAQSLQIDAVSGATLTSKTLLKALENALEQAQK